MSKNKKVEVQIDICTKTSRLTNKSPKTSEVKYKTEICKNFLQGKCKFGNKCAFAHGKEDLREKSFECKAKVCKQFSEYGYCLYGERCHFKHEKLPETASSSPLGSAIHSRRSSEDHRNLFIDLEFRGV